MFLFILLCGAGVFAQSGAGSVVPLVTVQATQMIATSNHQGVFTLFRAGDTNAALSVWYDLGGTASNGVDYAMIPPHLVSIAAGATSNTVSITPLAGTPSSVAKTVVLTLTNSPLMTPVNYQIGSPSSATVYLQANGATNLPPFAYIFSPQNGSVFYTPTNIQILAKAGDPDGSVSSVEFYAGATDLGSGTMVVLDPPGVSGVTGPVWFFNWLNPTPGNYPLTAAATDNSGVNSTSAPVNISVLVGPPTNRPPVVNISSPANGATFFAPVDIPIYAAAGDLDGVVNSVEFFANGNDLGPGVLDVCVIPECFNCQPPPKPTCFYTLVWSNALVGTWALTAQATDNGGLISTSAPVKITVQPSPPPPTNRPPIVDIVASDPIAIEGTNCWVWPGETNSPPTWTSWPAAVSRLFTNCGPKNATFTVRRFGDTNNDLTVAYAIGGTASNGLDYAALPGSVTIPAGEHRAFITIVPIDDGPPDVNKTVILTLQPDMQANPLPGYVLGFPFRAAAIILDGSSPRPVAAVLPDGCFHLVTPGPDAAWFYIESSTDMVNWAPLCTNQVVNGSIDFVDPDAATNSSKFYRAVPLNNPPAD